MFEQEISFNIQNERKNCHGNKYDENPEQFYL
jgi:hypothetical protein